MLLGAYGGLRLGEMLALRRHRVDLLHGFVDVAETVGHPDGRLFVGPPKTPPAVAVFRSRVVVDVFEAHFSAQGDAAQDAIVLPGRGAGGYLYGDHFRIDIWHPAVNRRTGTLRPHEPPLGGGPLDCCGCLPKEMRAGRVTSVVTVLDRYGHLLPGSEDKVNDALDTLASAATETPRPR